MNFVLFSCTCLTDQSTYNVKLGPDTYCQRENKMGIVEKIKTWTKINVS